jgi:hypothetical protein
VPFKVCPLYLCQIVHSQAIYPVPFNMQQDSQSQALFVLLQKCHKRLHSHSFLFRQSSPGSFCTWNARMPIQTYRTTATISNAKAAFQQLQIFICVRYANVSRLTPVNCWPDTYSLQLPLTFAPDPYSCTAVSIRVVSHSTNSMKAPRMMAPGRSCRRPARISMPRRKRRERPAVTMANGNSLH